MKKWILLFSMFCLISSCKILEEKKAVEKTKKEFYEHTVINNRLVSDSIDLCSEKFKIKIELIIAVSYYESKFDIKAINLKNPNGSKDIGVMQLSEKYFPHLSIEELYDVEVNIFNGCRLLYELLLYFDQNEIKAIAAYNCGKWTVENSKIPQKTLDYVNNVLKMSYELQMKYENYKNENNL